MNAETFVANLRVAAEKTAVTSLLRALGEPPGRERESELVRLSHWFNALDSPDQSKVAEALAMAAELAIYNVLLVFDGYLAIESSEEKGQLQLFYVRAGERTLLNDPDAEALSSLAKVVD